MLDDCEPAFFRGDTNADARIDITDAIALTARLFQGGAAPSCEEAADADDSGRLDLTDAIYLVEFLFQTGVAPPAPGPLCNACPREYGTTPFLGCDLYSGCP